MTTHLLSAAHAGGSSRSIVPFLVTFAIAYVCGMIARHKGRNRVLWFAFAAIFNLVALVVIILMPRRRERAEWEPPDQLMSSDGLRHTRTAAFPERAPHDDQATDEIEAWLKAQRPPGID